MNTFDRLNHAFVWVPVIALLCSIVFACWRIRKLNQQLRQASDATLLKATIDHNWMLYDRWDPEDFPCFLPSWSGLTKRQFGWRVLLLNHLNLLKAAFDDQRTHRGHAEMFDQWVRMGTYWFSDMRQADAVGTEHEGLTILRQLFAEEAYPPPFLKCLRDRGVLPPAEGHAVVAITPMS